jgi:hypothetical protein
MVALWPVIRTTALPRPISRWPMSPSRVCATGVGALRMSGGCAVVVVAAEADGAPESAIAGMAAVAAGKPA